MYLFSCCAVWFMYWFLTLKKYWEFYIPNCQEPKHELKIFRMQEPVSKAQLIKPGICTDIIDRKNGIPETKVESLQRELAAVKEEKRKLEAELKLKNEPDEIEKILRAYEMFLSKILVEMQQSKEEKRLAQHHLAKLEIGFGDLMEKYDRAKGIVEGYRINESILKKELKRLEEVIEQLNRKYEALRVYADSKLSQANVIFNKNEEENIHEVGKLKAKILESQVKIADLEKHVKFDDIYSRNNMFAPLKTDLAPPKLT